MAAYQKIDFHTHLESGRQAEELLSSMQQTDVTLSVILPVVTSPEQFQRINNHAAEINRTYPGKLLSFGSIHPLSQQYKQELNYIRSLGLPGIKLHPDRQKTAIDHKGYLHIIDYASELGLVIVVHAGTSSGQQLPVHCPPQLAALMLEEVRPQGLVLTHMGGFKQWSLVEETLIGRPVYLDCAGCSDRMPKEQLERIVNRHGSDKILFASDFPRGNIRDEIEWIESSSLTRVQKQNIYMKNACKLLHLHAL